eukprot:Partr_v1_DN28826_c1_g1_i2_m33167 putative Component of the coat protein complex II (COPII) which promotes the formation of transport vesicles from the endoplasmic reticulum (ER). The coat has two main functions, the physical deformation of the endoplasmic reticulum membrane into vesicles and the selection of cargo molecules
MKLASIERTATTSWGPVQFHHDGTLCPMIASGSVSGAFDASFSSKSDLEIFCLNLADVSDGSALFELGKVSSESRFNSLAWSSAGVSESKPYGILAGGKEDGSLDLYNPFAFKDDGANALILHKQAHTGQVAALDFNPAQPNLLATGASQGEIFIWDLNNPGKPYSPGPKSPRLEDLTSLAWNPQVSHILASASSNGYAVVWDLKNRREMFHLTSPTRKRITSVVWNPETPTMMATASDDDSVPAIYLWDVRNAHAPIKVLSGHHKGVMSLSWSAKDSDLLLSCGKDNRTLCWNPSAGEVVGEFPSCSNWVFKVDWCPKNPDLLSTSSFDGHVSFYNIQAKSVSDDAKTASSTDPFNTLAVEKPFTLKNPPKWRRTPVGAAFGFGNRLVSFRSSANDDHMNTIIVSSVVSDQSLVTSVDQLDSTIANNEIVNVCDERLRLSGNDEHEKGIWSFMKFLSVEDARQKVVDYLGFDSEQLATKFEALLSAKSDAETMIDNPLLHTSVSAVVEDVIDAAMNQIHSSKHENNAKFNGDTSDWGLGSPLGEEKVPGFDAPPTEPFEIFVGKNRTGVDADITRCIISGDFNIAVELCIANDRLADALVLAIRGGPALLDRTEKEFYRRRKSSTSYLRIASSLSANNIGDIIQNSDVVECWKEVLAIICTFASPEEFSNLAVDLADRLRDECDIIREITAKMALQNAAVLAYMVAGRLDKLVGIWIDQYQRVLKPIEERFRAMKIDPLMTKEYSSAISALVEKVTLYRKIVPEEHLDDAVYQAQMKALSKEYLAFAWLLINQGKLSSALNYLNIAHAFASSSDAIPMSPTSATYVDLLAKYRHRIYNALDASESSLFKERPASPFSVGAVAASPPKPFPKDVVTSKPTVAMPPEPKRSMSSHVPAGFTPPSYSFSTPGYNAYGANSAYTPAPHITGHYDKPAESAPTSQVNYSSVNSSQNIYQPSGQLQQSGVAVQQQFGVSSYHSTPSNPYGNYSGYSGPQAAANPVGPPPTGAYTTSEAKPIFPTPIQNPPMTLTQQPQPLAPLNRTESGWNDPAGLMDKIPAKKKGALAPIQPAFAQSGASTSIPPPSGPTSGQFAQPPSHLAPPAKFGLMPVQSGQTAPQQSAYQPPNQQAQYSQVSAEQSASSPVGHPVGDRSHIPEEHKVIFESLSVLINNCKPNAGPPQRKPLDDAEKRMNILFERLNNELVNGEVIKILLNITKGKF